MGAETVALARYHARESAYPTHELQDVIRHVVRKSKPIPAAKGCERETRTVDESGEVLTGYSLFL